MKLRTFNTEEEMFEAIKKDEEEHYRKTSKSGVLCSCCCYKQFEEEKHLRIISNCALLLPKKVYEMYESYTEKSIGDVTIIHPGFLKVIWNPKETDNYTTKEELCKRKGKLEYLLDRYLGQEIRLGRNIKIK